MTNFTDDDHAVLSGIVLGMLVSAGIPAYPVMDEAGNYLPRILLRVDVGHTEPMDVELEVRG